DADRGLCQVVATTSFREAAMRWMPVALGLVAPHAGAQALDYEYFKSQVEPIFLQKREGHARCYMCHGERSNNALKLETLPPGASSWTEEQSRKNFAVVSRLVVAGKPQADRKSTRLNSSH